MTWLTAIPGALRLVPRWVWLALAIAIAWHFALSWHAGKIRAHDVAVIAKRDAQWQTRLDAAHAAALDWRGQAERAGAEIATMKRKLNDEENRRIRAAADDLRLHGPGKAAAPANCRPGDRAGLSAGAGRSDAAGRPSNDAPAAVPAGDGSADWAVVPWGWLVGRGEQADVGRAEVLTWRGWYADQVAAWNRLRSQAPQSTPPKKGTTDGR